MSTLRPGMKVRYLPQPEWGVGHLVALLDEGRRADVRFAGRDEDVRVTTRGGALVRHALREGEPARLPDGRLVRVLRRAGSSGGLTVYDWRADDGEEGTSREDGLEMLPPASDLPTALQEGRVGDARSFALRRDALALDDERRTDALGALFASRVMVRPHQVGVVQRVLSAARPRFILADEVGLGKTIEAGMIFSALRLSGLASRVLVVTPSHLSVQWLVELFHKFNQLFTLMDSDRYRAAREEQPDVSPWRRFDKVVTSLEMLSRGERHVEEIGEDGAYWDLVIVDEAHHLAGRRAMEVAHALARNSFGLLLLTATPMQLDPATYHRLLTLIDPATAPTREGFETRLARQEELSGAVRTLLSGAAPAEAVRELRARFPGDPVLERPSDRDALLGHLAETYSLSDRLVRNRRAVVGGFAERRLHVHHVEVVADERAARARVLERVRQAGEVRGAVLAGLLRRLDSSPAAFADAIRGTPDPEDVAEDPGLWRRDAKLVAFEGVLRGIWTREPGAKVLVFTESRATLDWLRELLGRDGVPALGYHGDLSLVERDRQVARFRDPDGPAVLISTELGGEGRNFQFAHHLVNYDLPWSPAAMEQRIGRLDRIGQRRPVDIHVFDMPGTLSADVLALLRDAVDVFGQTVGGLDAVLEEVEPELVRLALEAPEARAAYAHELRRRVEQARAQVQRAYDPLLDLRSFDRPAVERLVERGLHRFRIDDEVGEGGPEDGLNAIARDLDERLEETVVELGRRVGIAVDTDEHVDAFQAAFTFGHELMVEGLPGFDIHEERTVLGTFWRDTAVEQEEIEYFATGHPLVESLFGFLRDGPYGRTAFRLLTTRGPVRARGLEVIFHLVPPEPEDLSPGARVPSRQLARFLDRWLVHVAVSEGPEGRPRADGTLLRHLEGTGRGLKGDEITDAFPGFPAFVAPALAVAREAAEAERAHLVARARRGIEEERDTGLERIRLSSVHQGVTGEVLARRLADERAHYDALLDALAGVSARLDSAAGFVLAGSGPH